MTKFDKTQVSDATNTTTDSAEALQKFAKEAQEAIGAISESYKMEPIDLGTGDTLYEDPFGLSQTLKMKNGDCLRLGRKEGRIISLTDKDGKQIAIPGDGKNLAPADSPTEMYRLSNGALYVRDKQSGEQTLVNADKSKIVIDNEGIREIQRGNTIVSFGRKQPVKPGDFIEASPPEYGELHPVRK